MRILLPIAHLLSMAPTLGPGANGRVMRGSRAPTDGPNRLRFRAAGPARLSFEPRSGGARRNRAVPGIGPGAPRSSVGLITQARPDIAAEMEQENPCPPLRRLRVLPVVSERATCDDLHMHAASVRFLIVAAGIALGITAYNVQIDGLGANTTSLRAAAGVVAAWASLAAGVVIWSRRPGNWLGPLWWAPASHCSHGS